MSGPTPDMVPSDLVGMTYPQVQELAVAYLDLLRKMTEALEECETGYGFFNWTGIGFGISGHPPVELVERLLS